VSEKPDTTKKRRDWKPDWLDAYKAHGTVTAACKVIGIGSSTAYDARARDRDFAKAWDEAEGETTKLLEETMYERALNGDTTAAIFILKARRPNKYRERVDVKHDGVVKHDVTTDFDREVAELVEKMRANVEASDPILASG
jgi:hypothetical protein